MNTHRPLEEPDDQPPPTPTDAKLAGFRRVAHNRIQDAETRSEAAVRDLLKTGANTNFTSATRVAGVSKAFLYKHPEPPARIRTLNNQQQGELREQHAGTATGESAVIAALRRKLYDEQERNAEAERRLKACISERERQIAVLHGLLAAGAS